MCQPEKRLDQRALTISWSGGRLLLHCKKSRCKFTDIMKAASFPLVRVEDKPDSAIREEKISLGRTRARAAMQAEQIMSRAVKAEHHYLRAKGFETLKLPTVTYADLRDIIPVPKTFAKFGPGDDFLCIPLTTPTGTITSLQLISPDGAKAFLPGGRIGGSGWFPCESGARPLILCEGVATSLSILRTSKRIGSPVSVAACMSAGGVAYMGRSGIGDAVMADNDKSGTGERAARETGLLWKMPGTVGEDFNDLEQRSRNEADALLLSLTGGMSWTVEKRADPPVRAKALSRDP